MTKLGYDSYLKIAKEVVWGDGTTPSVSVPIIRESIQPKIEQVPRASELRAGRFPAKDLIGRQDTVGGFDINCYPDSIGYFLLAMFGTPSASQVTPGVYDNTFEPGIAVSKSLSLEVSKAGANPLMVAGYMVNALSWKQGVSGDAEILGVTIDGGGKFATQGSPTAFTPPTTNPLMLRDVVMSVAGATAYLDSINWTDKNGLVIPNHKISGAGEGVEPVLSGRFTSDGSFVLDFENLNDWDKFRQATNVAIVATYTTTQAITGSYYYGLTVTMPAVRYDYPLPDIGSPDIAKATIKFKAFAGTVGASTVPISYKLRCGHDFSA